MNSIYLANFKEIIENKQGQTLEVKKYSKQANELIPRIAVAKPTPTFVIYLADLTAKLLQELKDRQHRREKICSDASCRKTI